jgi:hypothetical protein
MVSVGSTPDVYVLKLYSNGDFYWAVSVGGSSNDAGWGIDIDSANNVYVTGIFFGVVDFDPSSSVYNLTSLNSTWDMFVFKLDNQAKFLWAKSVGGSESVWPRGFSLDNSGNVIITGSYRLTVDFNPGSGVNNLTSNAYGDVFIEKLSPTGNFIWAKSFGGYSWDEGLSVAIDTLNNIYLTGVYYGTVDFDPGAGSHNLTAVDRMDFFIEKLDSLGRFIWAKSSGGVSEDEARAISINSSADVFVTGAFNNTVDFDPSSHSVNLTSNGGFDLFVQKFSVKDTADSTIIIDVEQLSKSGNVSVHPNPVVNGAIIHLDDTQPDSRYTFNLYDLLGKKVMSFSVTNTSKINFQRGDLPNGVYIYELNNESQVLGAGKLVLVE